jgi:hypothetical protein
MGRCRSTVNGKVQEYSQWEGAAVQSMGRCSGTVNGKVQRYSQLTPKPIFAQPNMNLYSHSVT